MTLTTHIITGTVIGTKLNNPLLIAPAAIVLHFLLDAIPHGDYLNKKSTLGEFWKVGLDLAIGFLLVAAVLFYRNEASTDILYLKNIAIGIFFSLLPDGITFLYWKMGIKFFKSLYDFHQKLHRVPDFSPEREFRLRNGLWDIFISFACLVALVLF